MNLVQITPGAGGMYCGNCLRDNALVAELRRQGHDVLMVPVYLPLTLDEQNQSAGVPIFFGGVNVYLAQQFPWLRHFPGWMHRWLDSPALLRWAAGRAAKTKASEVGDLTLSMLRGEEGRQARELAEMIAWLKTQPRPEVVCLSNALLIGMARQLRAELGCRIACQLTGEDTFLDSLAPEHRAPAWALLKERIKDADILMAPSHYFAGVMSERLAIPESKIRLAPPGLNLDGYPACAGGASVPASRFSNGSTTSPPAFAPPEGEPPTLGYFARMCREKGLDLLVDAFLCLRARGHVPGLHLKIGGSCQAGDEPFVAQQQEKLARAGFFDTVEFHRNLDRTAKIQFLQSLSVFSVPALYGEAFGLYLLEAMATGVPVVQPETASFPEIIAATGGGLLAKPDAESLALQIEALLLNPARARALGAAGHVAVHAGFNLSATAAKFLAAMGA
jgi:glycosyltransferase involved in cell wall biosynthesis